MAILCPSATDSKAARCAGKDNESLQPHAPQRPSRRFSSGVIFFAVQNRAVEQLLGTSFIDHQAKASLPGLRRYVFHNSLFVAITGQPSRTRLKTDVPQKVTDRSRKSWTAQEVTIPPMSQANVQERCQTRELCSVQSTHRIASSHCTLRATKSIEIYPYKRLNMLLSNSFPCPQHLSKATVIHYAVQALEWIFDCRCSRTPFTIVLRCIEETAKTFESFGEDSSQKPDADPLHWKQDVHNGSQEDSVRKDIMSSLL